MCMETLKTRTLATAPSPALADYSAGVTAFDAGEYPKAYAEFLPLARRGDASAQHWLGFLYADLLPLLSSFIRRVCSGYGPPGTGL